MICKTCGKENEAGVNFCVYCGNSLAQTEVTSQPAVAPVVPPMGNVTQPTQPVGNVGGSKKPNAFVELLLNSFNTLKGYFLKPTNSIDESSADVKKVAIIGGILTVAMMLFNLIMSMLGAVIEGSLLDSTFGIEFSNLEDLEYLDLILKNLLVYAIVMLAIAGIFYVGSLLVKKEVKYTKFLTMVFITAIPFMIGVSGVSTILRFIYSDLHFIAVVASFIYAITLFTSLVNRELKLENMTKIFYNAACYSILTIASYYIIVNIVASKILSIFGGF